MAVGGFGDLDIPESHSTPVEHWNGSAWLLVTTAASKWRRDRGINCPVAAAYAQ
jgi:hypothetical protein